MRKGGQFVLKDIDASSPLVYFNKLHDLILNKQYPHENVKGGLLSNLSNFGIPNE